MLQKLVRGLVAVAFLLLLPLATPAFATGPLNLKGQITDQVGALEDREGEVSRALDRLFDTDRLQLFVTYVDNFSGKAPQAWADETAIKSQLGSNDALLAVATGDRAYALSVDQNYPLTDAQLNQVLSVAIEPALRKNDWAGAAIGASNGISAALAGKPVVAPSIKPGEANPGGGGSAGFPWRWTAAGVVIAGAGAGGYVYWRSRRNQRDQQATDTEALSLSELDKRASGLLIETDDAIKTSEQELGFATAQFGEQASATFASVLEQAKAQVAAAFKLRQRLDDSTPEDDETRRAMLTEIVQRCEAANEQLDAQAAAFDRLRDLERNAPNVLPQVQERAEAMAERLPRSTAQLAEMATKYSPSALATVAENSQQAGARLTFAANALDETQRQLDGGETAVAAITLQAAQEAVEQAGQLCDAVDRLALDLERANAGLQSALAQTKQDLAEATQLLASERPPDELAGLVAAAQQAVTNVEQELASGKSDPLAATRRLEESDTKLDQALQGVRDERERAQRARASLEQTIVAARSEIAAATDFITTRRGGVGSQARTRLAEAQRHLDQAIALTGSDPVTALAHAQHAHALGAEANQRARSDVSAFDQRGDAFGSNGGNGGSGGFGGGMGGAVLGGILIESTFGGNRGGGGMFGGKNNGGGRAPGSFGGSRTRARRGGGGRF